MSEEEDSRFVKDVKKILDESTETHDERKSLKKNQLGTLATLYGTARPTKNSPKRLEPVSVIDGKLSSGIFGLDEDNKYRHLKVNKDGELYLEPSQTNSINALLSSQYNRPLGANLSFEVDNAGTTGNNITNWSVVEGSGYRFRIVNEEDTSFEAYSGNNMLRITDIIHSKIQYDIFRTVSNQENVSINFKARTSVEELGEDELWFTVSYLDGDEKEIEEEKHSLTGITNEKWHDIQIDVDVPEYIHYLKFGFEVAGGTPSKHHFIDTISIFDSYQHLEKSDIPRIVKELSHINPSPLGRNMSFEHGTLDNWIHHTGSVDVVDTEANSGFYSAKLTYDNVVNEHPWITYRKFKNIQEGVPFDISLFFKYTGEIEQGDSLTIDVFYFSEKDYSILEDLTTLDWDEFFYEEAITIDLSTYENNKWVLLSNTLNPPKGYNYVAFSIYTITNDETIDVYIDSLNVKGKSHTENTLVDEYGEPIDEDGRLRTNIYGLDPDKTPRHIQVDEEGRMVIGAELEVSDVNIGDVNIRDTDDVRIDPATLEKQDELITLINTIDFATETTLDTLLKTADLDIDTVDDSLGIRHEVDNVGLLKTADLTFDGDDLQIKLQSDGIGLATEITLDEVLKTTDLDIDINKVLGIRHEVDNVGLFKTVDFTEVRDLTEVGGVSQTGADWTPLFENLQNLDQSISTLLTADDLDIDTVDDSLGVRSVDSEGNIYEVANSQDISAGVTQDLNNNDDLTIFISTDGAIDITVEFSANGTDWFTYQDDDDDFVFAGAGDRIFEINFKAPHIRFAGSNTTLTTIHMFEVM